MTGINFGSTQNLKLPHQSEQMRWASLVYQTSNGPVTENLKYERGRGVALTPQSIIVDTTAVTGGNVTIIWDSGDLAFPIKIKPNVHQSFTIPAVENPVFQIVPEAGCSGNIRIDMLNFPIVPESFITDDPNTGANVNVTNSSVPVNLTAALRAGANNIGSVNLGAAIPAGTNKIGAVDLASGIGSGTQANAWNAAAVAAGGLSSVVDTAGQGNVTVFGNVSAATDLQVQYSQDNATFYVAGPVISLTAAGDFGKDFVTGARYIRLSSSAAATITATISSKI